MDLALVESGWRELLDLNFYRSHSYIGCNWTYIISVAWLEGVFGRIAHGMRRRFRYDCRISPRSCASRCKAQSGGRTDSDFFCLFQRIRRAEHVDRQSSQSPCEL